MTGRRTIHLVMTTLAMLTLACDPATNGADGGPADAGPSPIASPLLPTAPAPARTTCPSGWTTMAEPATCEPWIGAHPTCGAGERLAAGRGCVAIADDCAAVPPEVSAGAAYVVALSTGGDGSLARPFGTIDEAMASGARVIALAAGEHTLPGNVVDVTLVGACPTSTTLRVDASAHLSDSTLRRLRVTGNGGIVGIGTLTIDAVEITSLPQGVVVTGVLEATRVEMHDVPMGISANRAMRITLTDVSIERVGGSAISIFDTAIASLTRTVVDDVSARPVEAALQLDLTTSLTIESLVVEGAHANGMVARAPSVDLHHLALRGIDGPAAYVESSTPTAPAPVTMTEVWIRACGGGIVLGPGAHLASDLVIQDVQALGLDVYGARGAIARVFVDGAVGAGIDVAPGDEAPSDVSLDDVIVRHVRHHLRSDGGGLVVETGCHATIASASFETVEHYGIAASDGGSVDASNIEISDVRAVAVGDGWGVIVNLGGSVVLHTASIHDVTSAGIAAQSGNITADNLTVRHVTTDDDMNGDGVVVSVEPGEMPGHIELRTADVSDTMRWGVIATGLGASLHATDLVVTATHAAPCCEGARGGGALVVNDRASASVERFVLSGSELAGLIATEGVTAELEDGRIEDNLIGIIVAPHLDFNTGSFPGLALHDVVRQRNGTPDLVTETTVTAPSLMLR